jgi:hypothetical protein
MIKHNENVKQVIPGARTVEADGYFTLEVDYVTEGGITKTLRLAHIDADTLRAALNGEFDSMEPEERKRSFFASGRRSR